MSKKACAIYVTVLSIFFLLGLSLILVSTLYLTNGSTDQPTWVIDLAIVGAVLFFCVIFAVGCTTIASNYVRKNPDKYPSEEKETK